MSDKEADGSAIPQISSAVKHVANSKFQGATNDQSPNWQKLCSVEGNRKDRKLMETPAHHRPTDRDHHRRP